MGTLNTEDILTRLKEIYNVKTDKSLAEYLDIPLATLNYWKRNNKVGWDVIIEKCKNVSLDYLRDGTGRPFLDDKEYKGFGDDVDILPFTPSEKKMMLLRILTKDLQEDNPNQSDKVSVLYVDDEENNLVSFKANFRDKYRVYTAISGEQALQIIEDYDIHIIISDQVMPEMTGIELFEKVVKTKPEIMRILITGYSNLEIVKDAINKGKVYYYLNKPWQKGEIEEVVALSFQAFVHRKKKEELEKINEKIEFMLRQKYLS